MKKALYILAFTILLGGVISVSFCRKKYTPDPVADFRAAHTVMLVEYLHRERKYLVINVFKRDERIAGSVLAGQKLEMPRDISQDEGDQKLLVLVFQDPASNVPQDFMPRSEMTVENGIILAYGLTLADYTEKIHSER